MKRIFISFFAFFLNYNLSIAQGDETYGLLNYNSVVKNLEKSDEQIKNEKKKMKTRTWINRAGYFMDAYEVNIEMLQPGMTYENIALYKGKAKSEKMVDDFKVYVYDNIDLYFKDGALQHWIETNPAHEDPLPVAYGAFLKAIELDEKGKVPKKISDDLLRLKNSAVRMASDKYYKKDYEGAYKYFKLAAQTTEIEGYEAPLDTSLYFNVGLTANLSENMKEAAKYYEKAIEVNYPDVNVYYFLSDIYLNELKDTTAAIEVLKKGFDAHPDEKKIVLLLIDSFIKTDQAEAAIDYIEIAKKNDQQNSALFFAEGALREELDEPEKAVTAYEKAIELDNENFNAMFNLGVHYYNKARLIYDKIGDIEDDAEYEKARKQAELLLREAAPKLENAFETGEKIEEPEEALKIVAETLQTIYYRLKEYPEYQKKYDEIKMVLKTFE